MAGLQSWRVSSALSSPLAKLESWPLSMYKGQSVIPELKGIEEDIGMSGGGGGGGGVCRWG
jgi:hypothetical protein